MSLELIVGVSHTPNMLELCDSLISVKYSTGVKSIMLELPPNDPLKKYWEKEPFFGELSKRYSTRGAQVIWGDIHRRRTPSYMNSVVEKSSLDWNAWDYSKNLFYFLSLFSSGIVQTKITHTRDKGFVKEIENKKPQVLVLGRKHADYIKKRYPNVHYAAILDNDPKYERTLSLLWGPPYNPDEIIDPNNLPGYLKKSITL